MANQPIGMLSFCLSILIALSVCATRLPTDVQRTPSAAITDHAAIYLGRFFEEMAAQCTGYSGFVLIPKGHPAFTDRIAMTVLAEKSLDLQYYIWETDTTGRILALRLIEAAYLLRESTLNDSANRPAQADR